MKHSDSLKEIAPALTKAQAEMDRHAEAVLLPRLWKALGKRTTGTATNPVERFLRKVAYGASDCWYFVGHIDALGYGRVATPDENKAHRHAWRLFKGDIPAGMRVLHRCDVRNCVNPDHLFLGTQADNVHDMVNKGRNRTTPVYGEANHLSKLTADRVRQMRARKQETGASYREIAEAFGVTTMTAYRAIVGQSWSNI